MIANVVDHDLRQSSGDLFHSQRGGELVIAVVKELRDHSTCHDLSKTESTEVQVFDEFTPKLKTSTYGRTSTRAISKRWAMGLKHHYAYNRHHQEFFGEDGVDGMTLVDLIEMLPDWKAATERHDDGDLAKSLEIHRQSRAGR